MNEIHDHWRTSALMHGDALAATTKARTPKVLELDALTRQFHKLLGPTPTGAVLEMGCGNGVNCLALASAFPRLTFDGVDFVEEMIEVAEQRRVESDDRSRLRFFVGDAVAVASLPGLAPTYDLVFTDRCLINLPTAELQQEAIGALATKVRVGGHLVMIENSQATYDHQNRYRELLGLPPRIPAAFNLFLDEQELFAHVPVAGLELVEIEDFISLHDLVLYVLVPAITNGTVDYEHPLVEAATKLSVEVSATTPSAFGAAGQNRLYAFRRVGGSAGSETPHDSEGGSAH